MDVQIVPEGACEQSSAPPCLEVRRLSKRYGQLQALDRLDLGRGAYSLIVGRSASASLAVDI